MRNIIIACAAGEVLVLAAATIAGVPVVAAVRAGALRAANIILLSAVAVGAWVVAGIGVNGVVGRLPAGGHVARATLSTGDIEFNLFVLIPMALLALILARASFPGLWAAGRGDSLRTCLLAMSGRSSRS